MLVAVYVQVASILLREGEELLAVVVELVLLAGVDDWADEVLALWSDGPMRDEDDMADRRICSGGRHLLLYEDHCFIGDAGGGEVLALGRWQADVAREEGDEARAGAREGTFAVEVLHCSVVVALDGDDARIQFLEGNRGLHVSLRRVAVADECLWRMEVEVRYVGTLCVPVKIEGVEGPVVVDAFGLKERAVAHVAGVELVAAEEGELDVVAIGVGVDEFVGLHKGGVVAGFPHGVGWRALVRAKVLDEVAFYVVVRHEKKLERLGSGTFDGRRRGGRTSRRTGGTLWVFDAAGHDGCRSGGERAGNKLASCRLFHV